MKNYSTLLPLLLGAGIFGYNQSQGRSYNSDTEEVLKSIHEEVPTLLDNHKERVKSGRYKNAKPKRKRKTVKAQYFKDYYILNGVKREYKK